MGSFIDLRATFAAKLTTPNVEYVFSQGLIQHEDRMTFIYKGVPLDFTLLHVHLHDHPSYRHAKAIVEGHHDDLKDRFITGELYSKRGDYDELLKQPDENPRPSFMHALMLEFRGLYMRPETINIEGYGENLWFSGLIPQEKGLKPTEKPILYI